jgi:hypothetical protein
MSTKKKVSHDNKNVNRIILNVLLIILIAYALISSSKSKLVLISIILFFSSFINIKYGVVGVGWDISIECYRDEDPKVFWAIVIGQIILGIILLFVQYL